MAQSRFSIYALALLDPFGQVKAIHLRVDLMSFQELSWFHFHRLRGPATSRAALLSLVWSGFASSIFVVARAHVGPLLSAAGKGRLNPHVKKAVDGRVADKMGLVRALVIRYVCTLLLSGSTGSWIGSKFGCGASVHLLLCIWGTSDSRCSQLCRQLTESSGEG